MRAETGDPNYLTGFARCPRKNLNCEASDCEEACVPIWKATKCSALTFNPTEQKWNSWKDQWIWFLFWSWNTNSDNRHFWTLDYVALLPKYGTLQLGLIKVEWTREERRQDEFGHFRQQQFWIMDHAIGKSREDEAGQDLHLTDFLLFIFIN